MNLPYVVRLLLWPLSLLYGNVVWLRRFLYEHGWLRQKRLNATVISVGNLTLGGTGKTPMVLWLAEKFLGEGKRVAILSRGYRGSHGTSDEVALLQRRLGNRVHFGIGSNRYASGARLQSQHLIDLFLLDDGFQHRQLARDLDILMLDASRKLKNEWLLPAGSLREPITACRRADILIVSRKFESPAIADIDSHSPATFYAHTRLLGFRQLAAAADQKHLSQIGPGPFLAFCGIGNPDAFFADLTRWRVPIVGKKTFRDHHKYSARDVDRLQSLAEANRAIALVTTEKDAENIPAVNLRLPVWIAVIDLVFPNERELTAAIDRKLAAHHGAAA